MLLTHNQAFVWDFELLNITSILDAVGIGVFAFVCDTGNSSGFLVRFFAIYRSEMRNIMTLFKHELHIKERQTMVDITPQIRQDIEESGIKDGIVVVYCPHTTAGITINENADPDVVRDLIYGFEKVYPTRDAEYRHFEGNSHAHMKASTMGASQTLILSEGKPILGIWQDVYFCEFDGPRNRSFYVKVMEG